MLIVTTTAAFGNRWWLHLDIDTGRAHIIRERSPGGARRTMDFDTVTEARAYFEQYTTPVVAVES